MKFILSFIPCHASLFLTIFFFLLQFSLNHPPHSSTIHTRHHTENVRRQTIINVIAGRDKWKTLLKDIRQTKYTRI